MEDIQNGTPSTPPHYDEDKVFGDCPLTNSTLIETPTSTALTTGLANLSMTSIKLYMPVSFLITPVNKKSSSRQTTSSHEVVFYDCVIRTDSKTRRLYALMFGHVVPGSVDSPLRGYSTWATFEWWCLTTGKNDVHVEFFNREENGIYGRKGYFPLPCDITMVDFVPLSVYHFWDLFPALDEKKNGYKSSPPDAPIRRALEYLMPLHVDKQSLLPEVQVFVNLKKTEKIRLKKRGQDSMSDDPFLIGQRVGVIPVPRNITTPLSHNPEKKPKCVPTLEFKTPTTLNLQGEGTDNNNLDPSFVAELLGDTSMLPFPQSFIDEYTGRVDLESSDEVPFPCKFSDISPLSYNPRNLMYS